MTLKGRMGTIGFLAGGLALVAWMVFVLIFDPPKSNVGREVAEVAVFLPERDDWDDFVLGVRKVEGRGLIHHVTEEHSTIQFRTRVSDQMLRLVWHEGGGVTGLPNRVRALLERPRTPIAVIGSSNTFLTAALAETLGQLQAGHRDSVSLPVLLVPWATSVLVESQSSGIRPLLQLYPGRTFRFCPNNGQIADMVVQAVRGRTEGSINVLMVVDQRDPYSTDLARGFEKAIEETTGARLLGSPIELSEAGGGSGDFPSSAELDGADRVWSIISEQVDHAREQATNPTQFWVVLPLQGSPTRRMIHALNERATEFEASNHTEVSILCGDGIGRETLQQFSDSGSRFPLWCVSSGALPTRRTNDQELLSLQSSDVPAEIIATLAILLDHSDSEAGRADLGAALSTIELSAEDPAFFGRTLSFDPEGEREGNDLGYVLTLESSGSEILAIRPHKDREFGHQFQRAKQETPMVAGL